jgi:hypothetical protein
MARTINAGLAVTPMWRMQGDSGDVIDTSDDGLILVEPDPADYVTPPDGTKARIRLAGISETFEMDNQFEPDKGPTTNLRVEFQIMKPARSDLGYLTGKRFTALYTFTVGPRSNLGKLLGRLRGRDIEPGEQEVPLDLFIGTEFVAMTGLTSNGNWARISPDAIERDKIKLSPLLTGSNSATPQPELVGVATSAERDEEDDPFLESEDL